MLRGPKSLAVRAVAALLAVHFVTIALGLGWGVVERRPTPAGASDLALELAIQDLEFADGAWRIAPDGAFVSLAGRSPSAWLLGQDGDRVIVFGDPPGAARRLANVGPGAAPPSDAGLTALIQDAAMERRTIDGRVILLIAGGVDPQAVTSGDVLRSFAPSSVLAGIIGLSLLGAVALMLAIPLLLRAMRPLVEDAASIGPDGAGRRLDETRAPRELLPLARAFNAALDRLELELGRRKRLISNVSHELRTPLAVLALRVDALSLPDSERKGLRAEVDRLSRLTEQMLDLERLSLAAGEAAPVELNALASDVVASLAPIAIDAGYDLSLHSTPGPVTVVGDRTALERAVTNLIRNAIVHGGGGGVIDVRVGEGGLAVIDDGPGVPADFEPRLFEAFCRGGTGGGAGLGLHLTRETLMAIGGCVSYRREQGRSVFRLEFSPAAQRQAART